MIGVVALIRSLKALKLAMNRFVAGGNSASLIGLKYTYLYQLLDQLVANPTDELFQVRMRDAFGAILETLTEAFNDKHGFEPHLFHQVIDNLANIVDRGLYQLLEQERLAGRDTAGIRDVRNRSGECLGQLRRWGPTLMGNYVQQCRAMKWTNRAHEGQEDWFG